MSAKRIPGFTVPSCWPESVWGSHRSISLCSWSCGDLAEHELLALVECARVNACAVAHSCLTPQHQELVGARGLRWDFASPGILCLGPQAGE